MPITKPNLETASAILTTNLSNPNHNESDIADSYHKLGIQQCNTNQYAEAINSFQQELKLRIKISPDDFTPLLIHISSIYANNVDSNTDQFKQLIQNNQDLNGNKVTLKLLLAIHAKLVIEKNFHSAIDSLELAMLISNNLNPPNYEIKSKLLHLLLTDYISEADNEEINDVNVIISKIENILNNLIQKETSLELADAYHKLALLKQKQKIYLDTLKCLQQELKIRIKVSPQDLNVLFNQIGSVYAEMLILEQIEYFKALEDMFSKLDEATCIKIVNNTHSKLISENKCEIASEFLNQSLNIFTNLSKLNKDKLLHLLLEDYCIQMDNYTDAELDSKTESVLEILLKEDPSIDLADGYHKLGNAQIAKSLYLNGIFSYQQELQIRKKLEPNDYSGLMASIGGVYVSLVSTKIGDFNKAIKNCMQLNGPLTTISLLFQIHTQLLLNGFTKEAVTLLKQATDVCNLHLDLQNTSVKGKISHMLSFEETVEIDNDVNEKEEAHSEEEVLEKLAKEEISQELAENYHKVGVAQRSAKKYLIAVKAFHNELAVRRKLEPGDHVDLLAYVDTVYVEMVSGFPISKSFLYLH